MSELEIHSDSVVIELDEIVLTQGPLVENLMSISAALQAFLLNLINATNEYGTDAISHKLSEQSLIDSQPRPGSSKLITRKQLQHYILVNNNNEKKRGASDPLVSRRMGELTSLKVSTLEIYSGISARKKFHHYHLSCLLKLASLPPARTVTARPNQRRTQKHVILQKDFFRKDESAIFLQGHKELGVHIHQRIFNGILDSAMRLSHKDERQEIQVTYYVMGKPLVITTTCSTGSGSGISTLTDQRAMRPIIAYCKKEIARRKSALIAVHGDDFLPSMIPNLFRLDIYELCVLMGLKPQNENINQAVSMMRRLADTTFRVDARGHSWFKDNFSMMPGSDGIKSDIFEFRFLQNLEIAQDHEKIADMFNESPGQLRPRFYTFSLEVRLFYSLVLDDSSTLFISHPELSLEQSGIIQRFYNWARFWVSGRERSTVSQKQYSLIEMHEKLTPAARLDNFRTYFLRALSKKAIGTFKRGEGGVSLIYGYYVHYEYRDGMDYFRIERDRDDPIVGDNSRHSVLLRQGILDSLENVVIEHE